MPVPQAVSDSNAVSLRSKKRPPHPAPPAVAVSAAGRPLCCECCTVHRGPCQGVTCQSGASTHSVGPTPKKLKIAGVDLVLIEREDQQVTATRSRSVGGLLAGFLVHLKRKQNALDNCVHYGCPVHVAGGGLAAATDLVRVRVCVHRVVEESADGARMAGLQLAG